MKPFMTGILAGISLFAGTVEASIQKERALARFAAIRQQTKEAPTIADFRAVMMDWGGGLEFQELGELWFEFGQMQHPRLGLGDLKNLLQVKHMAIDNFHLKYVSTMDDGTSATNLTSEVDLLVRGRMVRRRERTGTTKKTLGPWRLTTYDGDVERRFFEEQRTGVVERFQDYSRLLDERMPINICKMFDSRSVFSARKPEFDLVQYLSEYPFVVQEKLVQLGERKGLLELGDLAGSIWLDPQLCFAMVKLSTHPYAYDSVHKSYGPFESNIVTDFSEFTLTNGYYFPLNIKVTSEHGTERRCICDISLSEVVINGDAKEDQFTRVFPRGATITDGIRNVVYRSGRQPSIAGAVADATAPKLRGFSIGFVLLNLFALIVLLAIAYKSRERHRVTK